MTGIYLRVFREGKWENIEVEYLTRCELIDAMKDKEKEELINWIVALAAHIDKESP